MHIVGNAQESMHWSNDQWKQEFFILTASSLNWTLLVRVIWLSHPLREKKFVKIAPISPSEKMSELYLKVLCCLVWWETGTWKRVFDVCTLHVCLMYVHCMYGVCLYFACVFDVCVTDHWTCSQFPFNNPAGAIWSNGLFLKNPLPISLKSQKMVAINIFKVFYVSLANSIVASFHMRLSFSDWCVRPRLT